MNFQNLNSTFDIRYVYGDLTIETTRAEKRWIKDISAIRCRNNDNASITLESIHLS